MNEHFLSCSVSSAILADALGYLVKCPIKEPSEGPFQVDV